MSLNKRYYDVFEDIASFPEAIIYIAYSRRGVGKTYSALLGAYQKKIPIVYIKRTIEDVDFICSSNEEFDASPYFPINRDHGTKIMPKKIRKGIGAFYDMNEEAEHKQPIAYCLALSAIKNIKGIDLSRCELMIFDEFIPQASETRVLSTEFDACMDLYATISRDREKRGRDHLKLLLFANAEDLYCPIIDGLQVMDQLAEVSCKGLTYKYIDERKILIHHVNEIPLEEEELTGIYLVMKNTKWARKSFGGEFSKVDFSNVDRKVLKNYVPLIHLHYREDDFYLYRKDRDYYLCKNRSNKCLADYDLNKDNDIRLFYYSHVIDLQDACMNGYMRFSDYSLYDLISHYSQRFKDVLR